jgi:hypothetical protein
MKLRDFVADALMEISHGVQTAIERRDKEGLVGRISPVFKGSSDLTVDWTKLLEKVEFDLAVTETSTKEASGEGGLEILTVAKLGAKGTTKLEQVALNRIKFSVSVLFPGQITDPTS